MSLLVEIATRADVPLEAVVRVLTREPVSEDAKARVLAVLDELDAEQTRVLQRFALAALHDARPPGDAEDENDVVAATVEPPAPEPPQTALPAAPAEVAPLVQLGPVLGDLAEAVRELRRETDAERRERVDDLAVLIDLITKGWEGLDRRLGRLERQLGRLESTEPPRRTSLGRIEPPPVPAPPQPPPPQPQPPEPPPPPPDRDGRTALRGRMPLIAALAVGVGVGAVAALDLPERSNVSSIVSASTNESDARRAPSRPPAATGSVLGEVATRAPETVAKPRSRKPATTATVATSAPAPTTTTSSETGFRPSRNWAWPPVAGADYYLVEFFRDGRVFYRARPTVARLKLPDSVVFTPGPYRWRVRAGEGAPAANDLEPPIVDSAFTVGG